MATIEVKNVAKKYGKKTVLENLSLTVKDGECFTLLGPSGCGKTVLLRLIAGFEVPDEGTISIGEDLVADGSSRRIIAPNERGLGVVFQDYAVWPHKNVYQNIAYPLELAKVPAEELKKRVMDTVHLVGLTNLEKRLPSELSGGQQQRVALARALVARPALLLLDEPLCNLDANLREEMRFEIKMLQRNLGVTILYVTHDQEVALAISDRVGIMDEKGTIRQIASPEEIFEHPVDEFVFRFMGVTNILDVRIEGGKALLADGTPVPWLKDGELPAEGTKWHVGFRPSDVMLLPAGEGVPSVIRRASFLGAMTEYRLDLGGQEIRTEVDTLTMHMDSGLFKEGDSCGIGLRQIHWFPAEEKEDA